MDDNMIEAGDSIARDRLSGAEAIAAFIGESRKRTFYLLETARIPAGKEGAKWVASRRALREHYRKLLSGEMARKQSGG